MFIDDTTWVTDDRKTGEAQGWRLATAVVLASIYYSRWIMVPFGWVYLTPWIYFWLSSGLLMALESLDASIIQEVAPVSLMLGSLLASFTLPIMLVHLIGLPIAVCLNMIVAEPADDQPRTYGPTSLLQYVPLRDTTRKLMERYPDKVDDYLTDPRLTELQVLMETQSKRDRRRTEESLQSAGGQLIATLMWLDEPRRELERQERAEAQLARASRELASTELANRIIMELP